MTWTFGNRRSSPTPPLRLAAGVIAGCLSVTLGGCDRGISQAEEDAIVAWLGCEECTDGERSFVVDSIGDRAVPFLRDALVNLPEEYRDNMAHRFGARWSRLESPPVDSSSYVSRFMSNFDATVQRRAARSLGDLGEVEILREALSNREFRGYRDDVVRVLEESRDAAMAVTGQAPATRDPPDSLHLWPRSLVLERGSSAGVEAVVTDADGQLVDAPVSWSSADVGVATVAANPGRSSATVTSVDEGQTQVTAATGSLSARVAVDVVPPAAPGLVLVREHGDRQVGNPGTVLPDSLVVEVTDQGEGGTPQESVQVTWEVQIGGAVFVLSNKRAATTSTGPDGRTFIAVRLGPDPGPVQVKASLKGGASVVFRLRAVAP